MFKPTLTNIDVSRQPLCETKRRRFVIELKSSIYWELNLGPAIQSYLPLWYNNSIVFLLDWKHLYFYLYILRENSFFVYKFYLVQIIIASIIYVF